MLVLDADERVSAGLKTEIEKAVVSPDYEGYYMPRKNFFLGKWISHSGWWPDHTLRLFKKESGSIEEREVHEKVVVKGNTGVLQNPLEHYTYRTISENLKKMDNYSTLSAKELHKQGVTFTKSFLCYKPLATFIKMFLLRQGFRDGFHGLVLALLYSFYTLLKYVKLWEMQKE